MPVQHMGIKAGRISPGGIRFGILVLHPVVPVALLKPAFRIVVLERHRFFKKMYQGKDEKE
jgi:hypothetical protein